MGIIKSKNLAMPDLSTATDLGGGNYRIYNANGITIVYNVNTGHFVYNGTSNSTGGYDLLSGFNLPVGQYTLSIVKVSGEQSAGPLVDTYLRTSTTPMTMLEIIDNVGEVNSVTYNTTEPTTIYIRRKNGVTYTNYTFKLQLEKGDTASAYSKPFIPLLTKQLKTYIQSKNLAMPDLAGKPEISTGVYRLIDERGITVDYNANNGVWTINGTVTTGFFVEFTNVITEGLLTAQLIHISGSASTGADGWRFADNLTGSGRIYWNGFEGYVKTKLKGEADLKDLRANFLTSSTFDNFQFKLRLEKGDTATDYEVPFTPYFAKTKKIIIQLEQGDAIIYNPDFNMEVGEND